MSNSGTVQDHSDSEPDKSHENNASQDSDSDQSQSDSDQEDRSQLDQPRPSASRTATHVTVNREEISSTRVQEGDEELHGLDVDVYDQQTYERSVFDQVDRAITEVDGEAQRRNQDVAVRQSSNINGLLRLIHGQSDEEYGQQNESPEPKDKDEQVLRLARLERLNRTIKTEPFEVNNDESAKQPQRIPNVHRIVDCERSTNSHGSRDSIPSAGPSTSRLYQCSSIKLEQSENLGDSKFQSSVSENSSPSEYEPSEVGITSEDDLQDDIDYVTDSEAEGEIDINDEYKTSNRKKKSIKDDGDFKCYAARVKAYTKARAKMRLDNILDDGTEFKKLDEMVTIEGNLQIPKDIWNNLYEHQKTGVRWLWELHQLGTGGILGDEMGLGKTIQMIAFLIALRTSNIVNAHKGYKNLGPTVLVCPATVMHQWLQEFRKWYPPFRVAILHSTGTFSGDRKKLVQVIHKSNGILICSYPGVIIYQDYLHALDWHYAILDEGHKIRNPDAQVTLASKRFRTPHRLILSGSPVQNNLRELWSIFDFIYPGKLGTLPVFMGQFSIPITQGGYANATDIQVQIAYKCACVLRDTIKPFLLRRTKAEVNNKLKLPDRSEQVLFCKLTDKQRKLYQIYLDSPTVRDIKRGMCQIFVGLIQLRKICNHPDLFDSSECNRQVRQTKRSRENKMQLTEFFSVDETYGHYHKSGKMMVVDALLKLWKKQGHKVLLFTQSRLMLKIFMNYLNERDYKYLKMDGSTPIGERHSLIEEFNANEEVFIFLLTTRVGGVGVNLIGANRIIIYDPDWNPSTDIQARERAWRIGQQRHVIIYRLLTAGTIEEKIYHRQVFKLYLTNRILKDAKQKRFFKTNDLHELFTLGRDDKNIETKALFDDDLQIDEKSLEKTIKRSKERSKKKRKLSFDENAPKASENPILSEEKLQKLRERAKLISRMIANQYGATSSGPSSSGQPAIKIEPSDGATQTNIHPVRTRTESGQSEIMSSPVSPSQPVSYCPAKQVLKSQAKLIDSNKKPQPALQHVEYLVKQDIYKPGKADPRGSDSSCGHEDYILQRLFKSSNIYGALKHDKIESDSTADFKIVESEAEKVARDAIRALRESRRLCLGSTSGIPNWTGQNGCMASKPRLVPKNKTRAQQLMSRPASSSSHSILSSIKKRNQTNPISLRGNSLNASVDSDDESADKDFEGKAKASGADDMAEKIREFIIYKSANNGEAQTDELLDFFKDNFEADKTAMFKAILYKMCEFQRRGKTGFWKLRTEFRSM